MMKSPQQFQVPLTKPEMLGPEHNPWFWNPNRASTRVPDADFVKRLHQLGEELEVTWNPINERWQIWSKAPKIQHKICQGWKLLFQVHDGAGQYAPLDERVLARLFQASVFAHGSAKQYFERVVSEMQRDKERVDKQYKADLIDEAMPSFDHSQIKVSGFGKSNGSKFSKYHS